MTRSFGRRDCPRNRNLHRRSNDEILSPHEQPESAWWRGPQPSARPVPFVDCQCHSTRIVEGHHASGAKRVHLLGWRRQTAGDQATPDSSSPRTVGGKSASALLLAGLRAPRAIWQEDARPLFGWKVHSSRARATGGTDRATPSPRPGARPPGTGFRRCLG
jgi:hypothetical protein